MGKRLDKLLIAVSMVFVLGIVACLYLFPEGSQNVANRIFGAMTDMFGSLTLIFAFGGILLLMLVSFSKYGRIKLGEGEPEYSTFKWVSMMICCGLGSATVYWAFIEWAYYIGTPGLGIQAGSQPAFEMSVPYTMFHWGISAWTLYALAGIPIAYHFHVRKNRGLSLSGIISSITGLKQDGVICRIVDVLFIFICFGGLSITLGVSVPLVTEIFCSVVGITPSFIINLLIIVVLSVIYSFSSYIGLKKGMAKISDWNIKLVIIFCIGVVVCGPTLFIISNTTQSIGLMFQNFIHMSLFTDSIGKSGFPEAWTIFYWLYWITYALYRDFYREGIEGKKHPLSGRQYTDQWQRRLFRVLRNPRKSFAEPSADGLCGYGWHAWGRTGESVYCPGAEDIAGRPCVYGDFLYYYSAVPGYNPGRGSLYHGHHLYSGTEK